MRRHFVAAIVIASSLLAQGCAKPTETRSGESAAGTQGGASLPAGATISADGAPGAVPAEQAERCERQKRSHPAGESVLDALSSGAKALAMVVVPCGQFSMGSTERPDEQPVHQVFIEHSFAMSKYEVTFEQYDAFAEATGREKPDDMGWGRGTRPVINVSWDDAVAFAQWLSAQTGKHYRLPTEAEWEYAARAGSTTKYTWGDELGVSKETSATWGGVLTGTGATNPVGSFAANAFGLHDVHGNAMEWVEDCFGPDYNGAPRDGTAREECPMKQRVLRGGSWYDYPHAMRSASRVADMPDTPYETYGFRLARDLDP